MSDEDDIKRIWMRAQNKRLRSATSVRLTPKEAIWLCELARKGIEAQELLKYAEEAFELLKLTFYAHRPINEEQLVYIDRRIDALLMKAIYGVPPQAHSSTGEPEEWPTEDWADGWGSVAPTSLTEGKEPDALSDGSYGSWFVHGENCGCDSCTGDHPDAGGGKMRVPSPGEDDKEVEGLIERLRSYDRFDALPVSLFEQAADALTRMRELHDNAKECLTDAMAEVDRLKAERDRLAVENEKCIGALNEIAHWSRLIGELQEPWSATTARAALNAIKSLKARAALAQEDEG